MERLRSALPASDEDGGTIAAVASAPGRGGIGVVRLSGTAVERIACDILGHLPRPRQAIFAAFRDAAGQVIDRGLILYFPAPASYTGESVLELQAHGSPVVLDLLLHRVVELGARVARPGEFTERAFLNGKLDLTQAEAVADLISSTNAIQARMAGRALDGLFGDQVRLLQRKVTHCRVQLEAGLDFSDEDIEPEELQGIQQGLQHAEEQALRVLSLAEQGQRIREGLRLVIAGAPNAGKSSLLNRLSGQSTAIVTEIPGTTRDLIHAEIDIDGMPLHLIDTAGLRDSHDPIEQEGMRRAQEAMAGSDRVLWIFDAVAGGPPSADDLRRLPAEVPITLVRNKIDLLGPQADHGSATPAPADGSHPLVELSAKTGQGVDRLREHLKACVGYQPTGEGLFTARRRHLEGLQQALEQLRLASDHLKTALPPEIVAEDLRLAQQALGTLTGEFTSDDLLGEIFSSFCIGK